MTESRPDPERLLARLHEREAREHRAKLKIFFGAAAGVGKTYAMLVEAHERRRSGIDVVVGLVETHDRPETARLLDGLEVLPARHVEHRGTALREFDLDAALVRRPGLLLLDELAHTNAPGSRHARRWQDALELLEAGIDVCTTLNVQHVDSLNDVVAQVTGITVRETVPDAVLDRADEIELVDLPPDDLLQRLRDGKVYVPVQARRAMENFFRKGNLIALRELALRQTADRVDEQMESWRRMEGIRGTWGVRERVLVCLGDPDSGLRLVRAARRMATSLKAEWIVVHVETPATARRPQATRDEIVDVMGFAEDLGAESALLTGLSVSDEILAFARERHVSRIVVGKPARPRWREVLAGSVVDSLVRGSGDLDVYVIRGEAEPEQVRPPIVPAPRRWRGHLHAVLVVTLATAACALVAHSLSATNLVMVYLLGVTAVAFGLGRGPAVTASVLSVAAFDFFFVHPPLTFAVSDMEYLVTFAVMLVVALLISTMASQLRQQVRATRDRERWTRALLRLSQELAGAGSMETLLGAVRRHVEEVFQCRAAILLADPAGRLAPGAGSLAAFGDEAHEHGVAQWVLQQRRPAGMGTDTLPSAAGYYLPLRGAAGVVGVLGVRPDAAGRSAAFDPWRSLEAFANQAALGIERQRLASEAGRARLEAETERLRSTLLRSVSHDLRTPLAAITGAATSLLDTGAALPEAARREMLETVAEEATRLNRLVGDLLDMTRLESGQVVVRREWHSLEEIVGAALGRLERELGARPVVTDLPDDLPLVPVDDVLVEQALHNLLDNALRHAPSASPITIRARLVDRDVEVSVEDEGPGLSPGDEGRVFEKFYRGPGAGVGGAAGVGLGLAIVRGIVEAHGGSVRAANRPGGGTVFHLRLPLGAAPPGPALESPETDDPGAERAAPVAGRPGTARGEEGAE